MKTLVRQEQPKTKPSHQVAQAVPDGPIETVENSLPGKIISEKACPCDGACPKCVPVQAKLKIGPTQDKHEDEADKVAELVMQPDKEKDVSQQQQQTKPHQLRKKKAEKEQSRQIEATSQLTPYIAKKTKADKTYEAEKEPEEEREQNKDDKKLMSGGEQLDNDSKRFYESRFGVDFSHVRLHRGQHAAQKVQAINAYAFTYGSHIWLGNEVTSTRSKIVAHELAHVVQQTQPQAKRKAKQVPIQASTSTYSLQRFAPYWEPASMNGTKAHDLILKNVGRQNEIFSEVPIPCADREIADYDKRGTADMYKDNTRKRGKTFGIYWKRHHTPQKLNSINFHPFRKNGRKSKHRYFSRPKFEKTSIKKKPGCAAIAPEYLETVFNIPKAETQKKLNDKDFKKAKLFFLLKQCKTVPTNITVGELKPAQNTIEASKGAAQVKSYETGIKMTAREFNDYKKSYPCLVEPSTTPDWHVSSSVFDESNLKIPAKFQYGVSTAKSKKLIIKRNGRKLYKPAKKVMGRLYMNYDNKHRGVWNYFWWPNTNVTETSLTPLKALDKDVNKDVVKYLTKAPIDKKPKRKKEQSFESFPRSPLIQRYSKTKDDPFKYNVWKGKHTSCTQRFKKLEALPNYKDFKTMQYAIDIHKVVNQNTKSKLPGYSSKAKREDKAYDRIDFWTGKSAKPFGLFRKWFGKAFVSLYNFFVKIKNKVKDRLGYKGKPKGFSKGGFIGTAIKVIFKALKIIGGIVLRKTMDILLNAIVAKVQEKLKEYINPDKLLELFLDEKKKKKLEEKIAAVKKLQEEFEKKISKTAEQLFEEFIKPYLKTLKKIEKIQKIVGTFTAIVNLVRWGARVIACLSPPAIGCLWILAEGALDFALGKLAETCWFLKKITPLLSGISFIKELPRDIAKLILKLVRDNILPESVHSWLPKPEDLNVPLTGKDEIKCDEGGDGRYKLTLERKALLELMEKLGEKRYKELALLLKKSGIPSDRKMTVAYINKLYELTKDIPLKDLKQWRRNYRRSVKGKLVPLKKFFKELKKSGESLKVNAEEQKEPKPTKPEKPSDEAVKPPPGESGGADVGNEDPVYEIVVTAKRPKVIHIDGDKAVMKVEPKGGTSVNLSPIVYNASWSHKKGKTVKLTIQMTRPNSTSGYIAYNIKTKVFKRTWHPNSTEKKSLKIHYKTLAAYKLDSQYYIKKGGVCYGYVAN